LTSLESSHDIFAEKDTDIGFVDEWTLDSRSQYELDPSVTYRCKLCSGSEIRLLKNRDLLNGHMHDMYEVQLVIWLKADGLLLQTPTVTNGTIRR